MGTEISMKLFFHVRLLHYGILLPLCILWWSGFSIWIILWNLLPHTQLITPKMMKFPLLIRLSLTIEVPFNRKHPTALPNNHALVGHLCDFIMLDVNFLLSWKSMSSLNRCLVNSWPSLVAPMHIQFTPFSHHHQRRWIWGQRPAVIIRKNTQQWTMTKRKQPRQLHFPKKYEGGGLLFVVWVPWLLLLPVLPPLSLQAQSMLLQLKLKPAYNGMAPKRRSSAQSDNQQLVLEKIKIDLI